MILIVGALFTRFRAGAVLLFWVAYVLTRPHAGALSDWLADDVGVGAGTVTLAAGILAAVLVGYLTVPHQRTAAGSAPHETRVTNPDEGVPPDGAPKRGIPTASPKR